MRRNSSDRQWWDVVKTMADMVTTGFDESELTEHDVRNELISKGFTDANIDLACEWVDKAVNSGTLAESLAMLQEPSDSVRVNNPLETLCFSDQVWARIELCCQKGLISRDTVERLLEGARYVDTRDWEDEEVSELLAEMLTSFNPNVPETDYLDMLSRCLPQFYS